VAKTGQSCTLLVYLKIDAIEDRLDESSPDWSCDYKQGPTGGLLCGITVGGVTRWDGSENTQIEAVKGGLSDAFKRAARRWGIGRYLWRLGLDWHDTIDHRSALQDGVSYEKLKLGTKWGWVRTPDLPAWALPEPPKDPSWEAERILFCAELSSNGRAYDDVAEFSQAMGRPRPSRMTSSQRGALMNYIASPEGSNALNDWLAS
tara:strand:- start:843 stop:1454 length:612 start_codon:yes stop_codon:yes gene_type:complete